MPKPGRERGNKVSVRIAMRPDVKERLARIADSMGLTMSALGAYVLGNYVATQETILVPMLDEVRQTVVKGVKGMVEKEGKGIE